VILQTQAHAKFIKGVPPCAIDPNCVRTSRASSCGVQRHMVESKLVGPRVILLQGLTQPRELFLKTKGYSMMAVMNGGLHQQELSCGHYPAQEAPRSFPGDLRGRDEREEERAEREERDVSHIRDCENAQLLCKAYDSDTASPLWHQPPLQTLNGETSLQAEPSAKG
jgi:hypothetical protein